MPESLRRHLSIVPDPEESSDEADTDDEQRENILSIREIREIIEAAARKNLSRAKERGGNRIESL